jgi:uncharacterized protein (DUF2062 family)
MQPARRSIDRNIKRSVIDVLLSYMMRNYSSSHPKRKIAPSVSYIYQHWIRGGNTIHAVEKSFAVDVFVQMQRWMEMQINCVHFAELRLLIQTRRE